MPMFHRPDLSDTPGSVVLSHADIDAMLHRVELQLALAWMTLHCPRMLAQLFRPERAQDSRTLLEMAAQSLAGHRRRQKRTGTERCKSTTTPACSRATLQQRLRTGCARATQPSWMDSSPGIR